MNVKPASGDGTPDLDSCAREPIHIPGAIQPHGALLVVRESDLQVLQASDNTAALFGLPTEELLGRSLKLLLGAQTDSLREVLLHEELRPANPLRLHLATPAGEGDWDGIVHRTAAGTVLELEPARAGEPGSVGGLYGQVRQGLARLQAARTPNQLCDRMAKEVQRITGLDRVMVYRFDRNWNGEVVAEVLTEGMDSFLGLHFPASDIPAQARELYRRNWLRLIADVDYRPAPISPPLSPVTGAPLDLSGSVLRSVSPVHLEYLRNMGVRASMSVSLLRDGELWGLVACHHRTPKFLSFEIRTACEFLGQTFSVQLGSVADEGDRGYEVQLAGIGARLLDRMTGQPSWAHALVGGTPTLPELASASGAAVRAEGGCLRVGATPSEEQIGALVEWLVGEGAELFHTDHLARAFAPAAEYTGVASGLLAAAVSRSSGEYLLWFRPEVLRTVEWAGNPAKSARAADPPPPGLAEHAAAVPRLHPRRSFAAWSETVCGRSLPWEPVEIRAAGELRGRIVDIVLRHAEKLARLNEELRRSNDELDAFTYIASHDLKEPLRGIRSFAGMLLADAGEALGEEGRDQATTLVRLSDRMDGMLDSLLLYSRAGKLELRRVEVDLQRLLDEVLDILRARIAESGIEVRVPRPLPTLRCDPVRVGSVFQNLLSNAIKYADKPDSRVEIGWREGDGAGGSPTFHVRDNGIGISPRHWDAVFTIFRRLHPQDRYGGGSGAGLTIARRLVERHGGRLWLESTPGEGTTFFFTFGNAS